MLRAVVTYQPYSCWRAKLLLPEKIISGKVFSIAPVAQEWRDNYPGTVVTWRNGQREDISVTELLALNDIAFAVWDLQSQRSKNTPSKVLRHSRELDIPIPIVSWSNTPAFSDERLTRKLNKMNLYDLEKHDDLWLLKFSDTQVGAGFTRAHSSSHSWIVPFSLGDVTALNIKPLEPRGGLGYFLLLNPMDSIVKWLSKIQIEPINSIADTAIEACWNTALNEHYKMRELMQRWENDPRIPEEMKPPKDEQGRLHYFYVNNLNSRDIMKY